MQLSVSLDTNTRIEQEFVLSRSKRLQVMQKKEKEETDCLQGLHGNIASPSNLISHMNHCFSLPTSTPTQTPTMIT